MDIDVKNALGKALASCEAVEKRIGTPVVQAFVGDIYTFISYVSAANSDERYEYFNKVYLNGKYPSTALQTNPSGNIPHSLKIMAQIDAKTSAKGDLFANTIISFFLVLGRYYSSSQFDRKDVGIAAVTEQIKQMNDYVKEAAPAASSRKETSQQEKSSVSTERDAEAKPDETSPDVSEQNEPEESLEELLENLNSLIGLKAVKQEVQQIINLIKVQKKGEEFGEKLPPLSLHLVFFGNPGTGKTTVARLLAKIYKCLGVLSTGQLVEVDRGGLVAGYVGQTAIKTQEVIDKAMGGILFIDEAYSLTHGKGETDFGQEAVDTILKAMEDHRDDFIVIVAGYPDLMREFVASNPGLKLNAKGGTPKKEKEPLTDAQVKTLLDTIRDLPPYVFVMIGLYSGLRREEILALQWDCVFLDAPTPYLSVRRAWHEESNRPVINTELKTKSARRDVPIPKVLVDCLREEMAKTISDYVIADSEGQPLSYSQFVRIWNYIKVRSTGERTLYKYVNGQSIKKKVTLELGQQCRNKPSIVYTIDFPVTPHLLRHTYITNLIHAGVDPKTVQHLAGHKNSKVTMDIYAKVKYNKPEELSAVVNNALE